MTRSLFEIRTTRDRPTRDAREPERGFLVVQSMTRILPAAVGREAVALLAAYDTGEWVPTPEEVVFAEDVAHGRWAGPFLRAALREAPPAITSGRLTGLLDSAAAVLEDSAGDQEHDMVLVLRQLVDALAPPP